MTGETDPEQRPADGIFRPARDPRRTVAAAGAVFALLIVAGIALRPGQDLGWAQALNAFHTGALGRLSTVVYTVFEPVPSITLTVALAALIWWLRDLRTAAAFSGVVALTWIPADLIKLIVDRGRPAAASLPYPLLPVQTDPSFPSGHTAFIVALAMALALVVGSSRWRPVVIAAGAAAVVLVAAALAIDAVHYPTDILASVLWSLAVAPAARLLWVDQIMPRIPLLAPSSD